MQTNSPAPADDGAAWADVDAAAGAGKADAGVARAGAAPPAFVSSIDGVFDAAVAVCRPATQDHAAAASTDVGEPAVAEANAGDAVAVADVAAAAEAAFVAVTGVAPGAATGVVPGVVADVAAAPAMAAAAPAASADAGRPAATQTNRKAATRPGTRRPGRAKEASTVIIVAMAWSD
ncbi:hypothetical protein [Burkholderia sp. ABCPW 14]|uniref:hypothetical protein n=1 Tax=Burkholderia sp. ABCPW 14 TaxID=1637860 RepID=UPI003FA41542